MSKRIAILQSNYIPWKGYFDIIHDVDLFLFYDEVQYTKRDWRNRNQIATADGLQWLAVPVSANRQTAVDRAKIVADGWNRRHWNAIVCNYSKAPYFKQYRDFFEDVYLSRQWEYLSELNQYLLTYISHEFLGCKTQFANSRDYKSVGVKHEKLLSLVRSTHADIYESGPAAKEYIVEEDYQKSGIKLVWKDYSGYPEYQQLHTPFCHNVSILDLLFNTGPDAPYYIWGWRET